jgi:hypothetical protein
MLEYLVHRAVLYPFYPLVELYSLREEKDQWLVEETFYRTVSYNTVVDYSLVEAFVEQEPEQQLRLLSPCCRIQNLPLSDIFEVTESLVVAQRIRPLDVGTAERTLR